MKVTLRTVILIMTVPFFLLGCGVEKASTPSQTIIKFDEANQKRDINDSKQYVDKDVLNAIEDGKAWWIGTYSNFINDYDKETKKVTPIQNSVKIKGDTATIDVEITHPDNSRQKKTYNLVKQDNQWKITMDQ